MKSDQDLYKQLRGLPKERLWGEEVMGFNVADPRQRLERVAVIRAVGMVFSRFGTEEEKSAVRDWLIALLKDSQEKIRRYAMAALPKIGAGETGEEQMLTLLSKPGEEREKRHLGRALEKVGGAATLAVIGQGARLPGFTEQKVKAAVFRKENPGTVKLDALLPVTKGMMVTLRCRRGLEGFVRDEVMEKLLDQDNQAGRRGLFRLGEVKPGCVTLIPLKSFSLGQLYGLRCFATVGIALGTVHDSSGPEWEEALARCIGSTRTRDIMLAVTEGAARYRLDFPARGHQRGAIRAVVDRAYALSTEILNDPREAPWSVDVIPAGRQASVELRPRLYPDPRLFYRVDDVAAASHPPLAACMVRLAGQAWKVSHGEHREGEIVWDPFCGSGMELIERALAGGVGAVLGTDTDPAAIEISRTNFAAANLPAVRSEFTCCDFRDAAIAPGSVSLIITNPPLGRRVRVKDMQGLFADLYAAAARALRPGGRLILANPLRTGPREESLRMEYHQTIDLGGFNCQLEMYRKFSR